MRVLGRAVLYASLALAAALAYVWFFGDHRDAAIAGLPADERRLMYARSMQAFEASCLPRPLEALAEDCRRQANLLAQFPECDAACQARMAPFRFPATR